MSDITGEELSNVFLDRALAACPVMIILRGVSAAEALRLARLAWAQGVRLVEVPLQGEQAAAALEQIAKEAPDGRFVGAGTVISSDLAREAHRRGAQFTVAPGWDPNVAQTSLALDMPHLPGVATGTEITSVILKGLRWAKAFPMSALGPAWLQAMAGPFPDMSFVAVGGVASGDYDKLRLAGASAIALGSSYVDCPRLPGSLERPS
jgi:Entner-Doudoroff aldolase